MLKRKPKIVGFIEGDFEKERPSSKYHGPGTSEGRGRTARHRPARHPPSHSADLELRVDAFARDGRRGGRARGRLTRARWASWVTQQRGDVPLGADVPDQPRRPPGHAWESTPPVGLSVEEQQARLSRHRPSQRHPLGARPSKSCLRVRLACSPSSMRSSHGRVPPGEHRAASTHPPAASARRCSSAVQRRPSDGSVRQHEAHFAAAEAGALGGRQAAHLALAKPHAATIGGKQAGGQQQ